MKKALIFITLLSVFFGAYLSYLGGPLIGLLFLPFILLLLATPQGPSRSPTSAWEKFLSSSSLALLLSWALTISKPTNLLHSSPTLAFPLPAWPLPSSPSITYVTSEEDKKAQKKTLSVRFGKTFGRIEYTLFLIISCLLPSFFGCYLPLLTLIPALIPLRSVWKIQDFRQLNIPFAQTGKLMILLTLLLCGSILAV